MTPLELATHEVLDAWLRGDGATAYRAAKRVAELAPGFTVAKYTAGSEALQLNRPREAVEWLVQIDAGSPDFTDWFPYWAQLTAARHMARDHGHELLDAGRARRQYPDSMSTLLYEVRALAALGRVEEIQARLRDAGSLKTTPGGTSPGSVMRVAGEELRAHGHAGPAQAALEQAATWHRGRPAPEAALPATRRSLARTLYWLGRWAEAQALWEGLLKEAPDNVDYHGVLGVIAVRQRRLDDARRISAELAQLTRPHLLGLHTLWRARIAAASNQRAEALALLREAFAQGQLHGLSLHTDIAFEQMRDDPGFRELIEPKG